MLEPVYKLFDVIARRIKKIILQMKYDNFTIAEYFRMQGAQIGQDCYIVIRDLAPEPYLVKIGDHVFIGEKVSLHTHDGGTWLFRQEMPGLRVFGPIVIEDNCFIGEGATILPNVTIGSNSIVGVGSVVIKDVPPNSIVMGVPARRFGSVEKYKEKCMKRWDMQRPPEFFGERIAHYEQSKNKDLILAQIRTHLLNIFHDHLN
jgi:acetyltransferase-like isoleucine patch superfamily enzyme